MTRRMWTGVAAGVLAATVLLAVALGAYRAGTHHEVVTRTLGDGQVVRVIDGPGYGWGWGPGPGFFLIPLLGVVLVVLLVRGRRGAWGPGRAYGYGWGCGPGGSGGRDEALREWHRHAHEEPSKPAAPTDVADA